jgi:two-component system OmpR family sensor kinase
VPAVVRGDADELHQVLANLLDNAVVHTPAPAPIEVVVDADASTARVHVVDHGEGVSDETAARAFERFYRADASRSRASGGSGLGLAIVAAIVGAHGGTVRMLGRGVDEPGGVGTTVTVELPLARAAVPARA